MFKKIIAAICAEWKKEINDLRSMSKEMDKLKNGVPFVLPEGTTWIPILEKLQAVELKPGDTLVIETRDKLSATAYEGILKSITKAGYKAILLEGGLTLRAVLRPDKVIGKDIRGASGGLPHVS